MYYVYTYLVFMSTSELRLSIGGGEKKKDEENEWDGGEKRYLKNMPANTWNALRSAKHR